MHDFLITCYPSAPEPRPATPEPLTVSSLLRSVRTVVFAGQLHFVVSDVGRFLGLSNAKDSVREMTDDETLVITPTQLGEHDAANLRMPNRGLRFLTVSGLCTLISRSRKPAVKSLRHDLLRHISLRTKRLTRAARTYPEALLREITAA